MFINTNKEPHFRQKNIVVEQESLFKYFEIKSLIKKSPNGKSGGIGGVLYEDFKDQCDEYCHVLVNIMNVMLINLCFIMSLERGYYLENSKKELQCRKTIYTTRYMAISCLLPCINFE